MEAVRVMAPQGAVGVRVQRVQAAPWGWRLRNWLRWEYVWGLVAHLLAQAFSALTGVPTLTSELRLRVLRSGGGWLDYGVVSRRCVTDAGVAFLVDDWDSGTTEISNFNYHGCGTGAAAESASDTALGAECTTVLNPDSTRATGTKSQPAANQFRSVGTLTFYGAAAVTEHGLFSQAATGGGTLLDRSVFAAVNVAGGDSIQFTYTLSVNSGG